MKDAVILMRVCRGGDCQEDEPSTLVWASDTYLEPVLTSKGRVVAYHIRSNGKRWEDEPWSEI